MGDNVSFVWDSRYDSAFQKIKQYLMCKPVLAFPKLDEPFVVEVDSSDYAAGESCLKRVLIMLCIQLDTFQRHLQVPNAIGHPLRRRLLN